jgi:ubiquinone biosynthesis monooxygenase Coq7
MPKPYFNKAEEIQQMMRVNYAGEYAAKVIYQQQINATANSTLKDQLQHMLEQEQRHLDFFSQQLISHKIRPSFLMPLWDSLAAALGFLSSSLGPKYVMMVTDKVEDVICQHYQSQLLRLKEVNKPDLAKIIEQFYLEEKEHQNSSQEFIYRPNFLDRLFAKGITTGCLIAIKIAKKI